MNVIGIDWGGLAYDFLYFSSAAYSMAVGEYTGEKIAFEMLINQFGQMPSQIEAVGHSLGAHLVGHLGRTIFYKSGEKISRVTGNNLEFILTIVLYYMHLNTNSKAKSTKQFSNT